MDLNETAVAFRLSRLLIKHADHGCRISNIDFQHEDDLSTPIIDYSLYSSL